mmetsp:Transcript_124693/g.248940  ORF Transcript_124693/g.248940 Transcript_124693/m.248940 type:complete len:205 (+) Transcript_124693:82-696(+)
MTVWEDEVLGHGLEASPGTSSFGQCRTGIVSPGVGSLPTRLQHIPTGFFFKANMGNMLGSAAGGGLGAGLGGLAVYNMAKKSQKCFGPSICRPYGNCLESCAKKGFMAGAAGGMLGGAAGSGIGSYAQSRMNAPPKTIPIGPMQAGQAGPSPMQAGPFDESTLGPAFGVWNSLEDGTLKLRHPLAAQGSPVPEQPRDKHYATFL